MLHDYFGNNITVGDIVLCVPPRPYGKMDRVRPAQVIKLNPKTIELRPVKGQSLDISFLRKPDDVVLYTKNEREV